MSLIEVDQLAVRLGDESLRIVDTRWYLADVEQGRREYRQCHIPGAIFLDVEDDLSTPGRGPGRHPLPTWDEFRQTLGAHGISPSNEVVVYDTRDGSIAARLWWMLRRLDHGSVGVLNGGWEAWLRAGFPVGDDIPTFAPVSYEAAGPPGGSIDRHELRRGLGAMVVLDARAPERYQGLEEPVDPIAGHIPTAVSAFHGGNVDEDGKFLSAADLRERFTELGADGSRPVVTYCGSGVTSCHNVLAMHLAGLPEPLLYPGSWSDWSTENYPVATGDLPGGVPGE